MNPIAEIILYLVLSILIIAGSIVAIPALAEWSSHQNMLYAWLAFSAIIALIVLSVISALLLIAAVIALLSILFN